MRDIATVNIWEDKEETEDHGDDEEKMPRDNEHQHQSIFLILTTSLLIHLFSSTCSYATVWRFLNSICVCEIAWFLLLSPHRTTIRSFLQLLLRRCNTVVYCTREKSTSARTVCYWSCDWMFSTWRSNRRRIETSLCSFYTKKIFIDPSNLIADGIPVIRICQEQNQALIGSGTIVHWGKCAHFYSINEAINFIPVSWLTTGLPHVLEYMKFLVMYIDWLNEYKNKYESCTTAMWWESVLNMLRYTVPWIWKDTF